LTLEIGSEIVFTMELETCALQLLEIDLTAKSTLEFESKKVIEAKIKSLSTRCGNL